MSSGLFSNAAPIPPLIENDFGQHILTSTSNHLCTKSGQQPEPSQHQKFPFEILLLGVVVGLANTSTWLWKMLRQEQIVYYATAIEIETI